MTLHDKVAWSQGMFLQPHHFQQETRALEHLIDTRLRAADAHAWGHAELVLDESLLALGRVGLVRARGVLPDGTPYALPDHDPLPAPLEVPADLKGERVCLAAPLARAGATDFDLGLDGSAADAARYGVTELQLRDQTNATDEPQTIQVGRLRLRLLRERELGNGWTALGVVRVIERRADAQVVLDRAYIPPQTRLDATEHLHASAALLHGRLQQFARLLAERMGSAAHGVSEIADFLLLMTLNRNEPLFRQFAGGPQVHPALFHRACLQLAGELSSFGTDSRTPREFALYRHDDLQATFATLIEQLRVQLSGVPVPRATPIELTDRQHGFRTAVIRDTELLRGAAFVLAVHAQLPAEQLSQRFLAHAKVGPVERIKELVSLALPGIALRSLPVAPRQLPFHAGHHYFEVQRDGELWKQLEHSGNLALHVAGDFPGLELQLWAIRP